jgi:hypothetical protein
VSQRHQAMSVAAVATGAKRALLCTNVLSFNATFVAFDDKLTRGWALADPLCLAHLDFRHRKYRSSLLRHR